MHHERSQLDSATFNTARHPRSAIALKGKKLYLITVDGRNDRAAGMSLFELASFLKWMNADDAINLDGGGSTTLWVQGFPDGGVINHPSDNKAMMKSAEYKPGTDLDNLAADDKKWDHAGERPVANVILVNKKK
jgi:exopolysaccharide biosynthesis protein